ncbi:hypothetical protein [Terrimonas pollutisoli]|uniref:hypothetical protein n=1 Tax=Terrimonas pollutisoli TaxID=3034147 RepID=UPI0023ECA0C6|nr:hypothetical protein [Terrimonas sp. H1YJ31]
MSFFKLFIYSQLLFFFSRAESQNVFIKQIDSIVYEDYEGNHFSQEKQKAAKLCAEYIRAYYGQSDIPLIYLDIDDRKDSISAVGLAYDNLYGNALENNTYNRQSKYYKPGIRIKLHGSDYNNEAMLKLLDYGVNNFEVLKKRSDKVAKLDYYDRPKSPVLSLSRLNKILRKPANRKIKGFMSANK